MKPPSTSGITRFNFFFLFVVVGAAAVRYLCMIAMKIAYEKSLIFSDLNVVLCMLSVCARMHFFRYAIVSKLIGSEKPIASLQASIKVKGTIANRYYLYFISIHNLAHLLVPACFVVVVVVVAQRMAMDQR